MKKIISLTLSLVMASSLAIFPVAAADTTLFPAINTYTPGQFADVSANNWFATDVASVYEIGLMKGSAGNLFSPDANLDFAAAITLAARLNAIYNGKDLSIFTQTDGAAWYDTYVQYAIKEGFWKAATAQDYSTSITRGQLCSLFAAALPVSVYEPINKIADGMIYDVPMTHPDSKAIYLLYRAGILRGTDDYGNFSPDIVIGRSSLAAVLVRTTNQSKRLSIVFDSESAEIHEVLDLVNVARVENNLPPVKLDETMLVAANIRAKELVAVFDHTRPDGTSWGTALTQAGTTCTAAGENIAWGQPTPKDVVDTWLESPGHRANILSPAFGRLGVGIYRPANGTAYWVQLFCD